MKTLLSFIFIMISIIVTAPPNGTASIAITSGMRDETLLNAIMAIETHGYNEKAINKKEMACGILQIRPVMINEVNRILKLQGNPKRYVLDDALNKNKSIEIFWIIQKYHNPTNDLFIGAVTWNGKSVGNKYYRKIIAHLLSKL